MPRLSRKIPKETSGPIGSLWPAPATQHLAGLAVDRALDEELRAALVQAAQIETTKANRFRIEGLVDAIECELEARRRREKHYAKRGI
jgi:hypothetical protein